MYDANASLSSIDEPNTAQDAQEQLPSQNTAVKAAVALAAANVPTPTSATLRSSPTAKNQQNTVNVSTPTGYETYASDPAKIRALQTNGVAAQGSTPPAGGMNSFAAPYGAYGATAYYGPGGATVGHHVYQGSSNRLSSQQAVTAGGSTTTHQQHSYTHGTNIGLPQMADAISVMQGSTQYQTSGIYQHSTMGSISRIDVSQQRVIGERVVEHEIKVPKKVVREDVVEKIIVIPERIVHEEVIEDVQKIREKIIEVAVPVIQERIVEVPEIEYVERIIEVPEVIVQEKVREVPRVEIQERIIEIPRIVTMEKIVEVPEIEYRDIPVEKVIEVPEIREQIVVKEVPVPQFVEKPVPQYVDIHQEQEIARAIPIPVEAVTTCEFKLPRIRPRYTKVDVPLYVPRFVEVPIPLDVMDSQVAAQAETYAQQVATLAAQSAVSMCEVENLAGTIKSRNFEHMISQQNHSDIITQHWMSGRLQVDPMSMVYASSSSSPPLLETTTTTTTTTTTGPRTTGLTSEPPSFVIPRPPATVPVPTTASIPPFTEQVIHTGATPVEFASRASTGGVMTVTTAEGWAGTQLNQATAAVMAQRAYQQQQRTSITGNAVLAAAPVHVGSVGLGGISGVIPTPHFEHLTKSAGITQMFGTPVDPTMTGTTTQSATLVAVPPMVSTHTSELHRETSSSVEVEVTETKTTTVINSDGTEATNSVTRTERHSEPAATTPVDTAVPTATFSGPATVNLVVSGDESTEQE